MIVKYSDGELRAPTKDLEFVDTYPKPPAAHIQNAFSQVDRLGDLPYKIRLWPDDKILYPGRNQSAWTVTGMEFDASMMKPTYTLKQEGVCMYLGYGSWDEGSIRRGNVYHLYHDPKQMKFASDQEELEFWAREGISVQVSDEWEHSLSSCTEDFERGDVHLVCACTNEHGESLFRSYKLHDIFGMHKTRVHELTMRTLRNYFKGRLLEGQ
ncbi:hypothetical protein HZC00_00190 [Candidatus Kaiserbacteria bacterium]|nr:hypothetical protein [Candidatus Kaiserbacteria bacterium]